MKIMLENPDVERALKVEAARRGLSASATACEVLRRHLTPVPKPKGSSK